MNHLFIPKQESLDLKELGFDEPCIAVYRGNDLDPVSQVDVQFKTETNKDYSDKSNYWLTAPLYSQVFDWFREKHGYIYTICRVYNWNKEIPEYEGFCVYIGSKNPKVKLKCNDHFISNFYQDYREAELVVLQTLIEIVKNNNTTRS